MKNPFFKVRSVIQDYFAVLEKGKVGEIRTIIAGQDTEGQGRCYIHVGFVDPTNEKMPTRILIADDQPNVRTMLQEYLEAQGFRVEVAADGLEALQKAAVFQPELVLMDVMMPHVDGYDFIRTFRRESDVPVILLTARQEETDKVIGLELGADDYVTKPFGLREVLARINAILRRTKLPVPEESHWIRIGRVALHPIQRRVKCNGIPISLTPKEFDILQLLMESRGQIVSRGELFDHLHDEMSDGTERTIDVHIRNLRVKLEADPKNPQFIATAFGAGYRVVG
ncbi:MAG TPA: response regulator transcription factor [Rhodothermales bacterium]|nr:response regulator transcription factor [Rhodothermales bacterium]